MVAAAGAAADNGDTRMIDCWQLTAAMKQQAHRQGSSWRLYHQQQQQLKHLHNAVVAKATAHHKVMHVIQRGLAAEAPVSLHAACHTPRLLSQLVALPCCPPHTHTALPRAHHPAHQAGEPGACVQHVGGCAGCGGSGGCCLQGAGACAAGRLPVHAPHAP